MQHERSWVVDLLFEHCKGDHAAVLFQSHMKCFCKLHNLNQIEFPETEFDFLGLSVLTVFSIQARGFEHPSLVAYVGAGCFGVFGSPSGLCGHSSLSR